MIPSIISAPSAVTGKSNLGVTLPDAGMFKNLALTMNSFQSSAGYIFPNDITSDGYPKNGVTLSQAVFGVLNFPSNSKQSDTYVLKWKSGTGQIQLGRGAPGFTNVSATAGSIVGGTGFNLVLSGTAARCTFKFATSVPASVSLALVSGVVFSGNFSGLVLCKAEYEADIDAATLPDHYWDDDYINQYLQLHPGIVRCMGWTNPNSGNVSQSKYIQNWQTGLLASSRSFPNGAWAGNATDSGSNTYVASAQPDAGAGYIDGETIIVNFVTANTGAATFNSSSRGAVQILQGSGGNTGLALSSNQITANQIATLTYDALLNAFMYQAGGLTPLLPYELQAGFANRLNANYWANFHSYVDNASATDITQRVATYLKPLLTAYFELGNEVWNPTFPATAWAGARGRAFGFPTTNNEHIFGWHGLRTKQVMDLVTSAWSGARGSISKLKRVMAIQAYGATSGTKTYRLNGADLAPIGTSTGKGNSTFVSFVGNVDYTAAGNRPVDVIDVLSYATYYSGAQTVQFDANYVTNFTNGNNVNALTTAADNYASGDPTLMASALSWLDGDINSGSTSLGTISGTQTLQDLNGTGGSGLNIYGGWETVAASYSTFHIECYEGGFGAVAPSTATCTTLGISTAYGGAGGKIDNLIQAYRNSPLFFTTVQTQITQFMSRAHSVTPAWLLLPGPNAWSLTSGDSFATRNQAWYALQNFNA